MSRAHRYPKPAEVMRELEEAFISRGFTPEEAAIIADGWGVADGPQTAAQWAVQMRAYGGDAVDLVAWFQVSRDLMALPLSLAWAQRGYTPIDLISLAWACRRTTGWNNAARTGWAAADIPPHRAVLYAAASVAPGEALAAETSDDPPSEETLRMMVALHGGVIPELSACPEREHEPENQSEHQSGQEGEAR